MAEGFCPLQRLQRLGVLNRASLLHVQRLLVVGKLVFQLIHFQLGGFGAGFVLFLLVNRFRDDFILFFEANLQFIKIRFIALDFFLLAQSGLHQVQMVAGGLIIGFQIAFRAVMFLQLAGHIDVLILFRRELSAGGEQIPAIFQRFIEMNAPFIGVTHIVGGNVVGGFADQMLEQIAVRLRHADSFQRHAVFTQRRFHILERLTHAAVFRQQVVAQRASNGARNTAVQRGFDQAIVFATVRSRTQAASHHAQVEHQRVILGNRVKLLELHPFHRFELIFQLVERHHARLAFVKGFGQQLSWLDGGWQALDRKRLDIDFTIATGDLL